jgi:hypothetical protein
MNLPLTDDFVNTQFRPPDDDTKHLTTGYERAQRQFGSLWWAPLDGGEFGPPWQNHLGSANYVVANAGFSV